MEAFMREETGNDHISLGMRTPSGEYERPIPGTVLFRTQPGNLLCFQYTQWRRAKPETYMLHELFDAWNNFFNLVFSFSSVSLIKWGFWAFQLKFKKNRASKVLFISHKYLITVRDRRWLSRCTLPTKLQRHDSQQLNVVSLFFS